MVRAESFEVAILGGIGALLIFVNGAFDAAWGVVTPAPVSISSSAVATGLSAITVAVLLAVFLWLYWDSPTTGEQRAYATLVALLGAISIWLGGGFYVGALLAFAAGLLGIILAKISEATQVLHTAVEVEKRTLSSLIDSNDPGAETPRPDVSARPDGSRP